jgi:hypothetical protein
MRVHTGHPNLDRHEIAAPDIVLLRHFMDMSKLGLDLHRAFGGTRRCDGLARQRGQAADIELPLFVPVAAPDLARRHRI